MILKSYRNTTLNASNVIASFNLVSGLRFIKFQISFTFRVQVPAHFTAGIVDCKTSGRFVRISAATDILVYDNKQDEQADTDIPFGRRK